MTDDGLSKLGQIAVSVRDLGAMTAFYRDVLRVPFTFEVPGMAFFDCDGTRLMLAVPQGLECGPGNSILYFRVPDIGAAHAGLLARGVDFERGPFRVAKMPDHELWMAFFRDVERNLLALMSEVRPGGR